jgi:phage-related protein
MPLTISSQAIAEKNKLSTDGYFIILLDIVVPGLNDPIRVTSDNIDTVWNGETYVSFPFEIQEISDTSKSEIPQVDIKVSNVSRAMEFYLQEYDTYCKTNGYSPVEMTISVVHSNHLDLTTPEVEYVFNLKKPATDSKWATFTLSASNPFNRRFPLTRMTKNRCRYKSIKAPIGGFKGTRCGYTGVQTACDGTLSRCRELENSTRFGGFPGIGNTPLVIA